MKYNRNTNLPNISLASFDWSKTDEGPIFWMNANSEYFTFIALKMKNYMANYFNTKYKEELHGNN